MELIINATNGTFNFHLPESHTVRFRESGRGVGIVIHIGHRKLIELALDHDIEAARVTNSQGLTVIDWPEELTERIQSDLTTMVE